MSQHTVLVRASDLSLRVRSNGDTVVGTAERRYWAGSHALAILDTFSTPQSLARALETLQGRAAGAQDWVDLTETIVGLYKAGLLVAPGAEEDETVAPQPHGFESPAIHVKMLDDRRRTGTFITALQEVVREGDVVVDLGTGTGVLAVAAVRAGAARVYAIEAGGVRRFARTLFEANGVADRITLLEGWSTQLKLPEKADVLVGEIIGNEPLAERVLEATLDARKRFLKPTARIIPRRVRVLCTPMSLSPEDRHRWRFTPRAADRWRAWYGTDFTALVEQSEQWSYFAYPDARTVGGWLSLGSPAVLADIDLADCTEIELRQAAPVTIDKPGTMDALVIHFRLELGDTTELVVDPSTADPGSSWRCPAWLVAPPPDVSSGDRFEVMYQYRSSHGEARITVSRI